MFVRIKGLKLPKRFEPYAYQLPNEVDQSKPWADYLTAPSGLIQLGETNWPAEIKEAIVSLFKDAGVEDPLRQKLVEPRAMAFGGRPDAEGNLDLSRVNWELVEDYFTWEVASMLGEPEARKLQEEARKKYGGVFNHRQPYGG